MEENSNISPDMKKVANEKRRLSKLFKEIEPNKKSTILGLIERAAFMRVSLQVLEADLNKNGFTEIFQQGKETPYMRQRPAATIYATMNTSYQKIIKQLTDLLPKDEVASIKAKVEASDGFDEFITGRDAV